MTTTVRFIPAPEIATTEGNKYLNTLSNYSAFLFLSRDLFSLIPTVCFLPAPEISTTEGNKYVSIIETFNAWFYCEFVIISDG